MHAGVGATVSTLVSAMAGYALAGTCWSVLLPVIINPFGLVLCRVFAAAAVP